MKFFRLASLFLILLPLYSIASPTNQNFIVRVTGIEADSKVNFSGKIMAMTPNGFMPNSVSQVTPVDYAFNTTFVSVKLHATSFFPKKIRVEIIERTKNHERVLIRGMGSSVLVQAGTNGFVFVGSN